MTAMREVNPESVVDKFPPKELTAKCHALIKLTRIPNLKEMIVTKENMVTLALLPDMVVIMRSPTAAFKLRIVCWIAASIAIGCAWAFNWWILVAALVALIIERKFAAQENQAWKFLAAVLLSLEVLANDFAGWGTARPDDRRRAIKLMGQSRQVWLNFVLPRRGEISEEQLLQKFGPSKS